jgi:hypothetical protein
MEEVYLSLLTPELAHITKPKYNKLISYGKFFDIKLIYSLAWIYQYYFENPIVVYFPKCVDITSSLCSFNKLVGEFPLSQEHVCLCTLQSIENVNLKVGAVAIYGYSDIIFHELSDFKRRIHTQLKKIKGKVHFLSFCKHLIDVESYFIPKQINYTLIDVIEEENDNLIELVNNNKDRKIYISVENVPELKKFEKELMERDIQVSRKETDNGIVLNSSKVITNSFLKNRYDIYIFIYKLSIPMDALYYLKECHGQEIYFDSTSGIQDFLEKPVEQKLISKDSREFENYEDLVKEIGTDFIMASEGWYRFNSPETFKLDNLTKKNYDEIRNFVKLKLNTKLDLDIRTCQMGAPCSPRDRSRKLNSLSNKISSFDYRCDITCEIFKDHTIGVVLWNEIFASKNENKYKGNYVYQTTSGKWKYTTVQ